jgi:hypothetical protein
VQRADNLVQVVEISGVHRGGARGRSKVCEDSIVPEKHALVAAGVDERPTSQVSVQIAFRLKGDVILATISDFAIRRSEAAMPALNPRIKRMKRQTTGRRAIAALLPNSRQLAQLTQALAKTADLHDAKGIRDWAEAARKFAQSAGPERYWRVWPCMAATANPARILGD